MALFASWSILCNSSVFRQLFLVLRFSAANFPGTINNRLSRRFVKLSTTINSGTMSWCGGAPMSIWDDKYLSPCFIDTFGYISVLVYFVIVGSVRLKQIQKYPYSKNVPRTGIHIYELLSSALLLFILFVITIVQFANSDLTFSSGLAKLLTGATWAYSMYLQQMEYGRSLKHNWAIKSYWLLLFIVESIQLQSYIKHRDFGAGFVGCLLIFVDLTALCITTLFSQADPPLAAENYNEVTLASPEDREALDIAVNSDLWSDDASVRSPQARRELKTTQPIAPEVRASAFKRLTYTWILPMLRRGYRRALAFADLPPLAISNKTHYVTEVLDHFWQEQLSRPGLPSLFKATWKAFGVAFSLAAFFKVGNDLLAFAGPLLLRKILQFIRNEDEEMWHGLFYAVAMLVCSVFQTLCINAYFTRVYRVGMNVRASFVGLIYRKTFNLSNKARTKYSVGEIVTHQSVDAQKLQDSITYLHMIWSAPLQIIISIVLLWQLLGVAALIGLLVMVALMPVNYKVAQKMGVFQKELMGMKDKRGKATNEIIQGIRVIKYFAWEASFVNKITDIRNKEVAVMRKSSFLRAFAGFFWTATPLLVSATSFVVFSLLGHNLTAEIAFTSLSLFNILRFPLTVAPRVVQSVVESKVSVERVQKYLVAEELDKTAVTRGDSSDYHTHDTDIAIKDGTFSWTEEAGHYSLRNINVKIKKGSLVAVVGPVGSGKSTLLYALLGELIKKQGTVTVNGSMAYASQQPWIRNATLRDNVTFGLEFDKDRYDAALRVCEMNSDLQILPAGDMTEIGEKGINLSGGQKQRVSLARAVYQHSDIYLLDDPLSAVDAHVGQAIFNNCIRDYLEGTTRVLVTHQLQYLPYVDQIIVFKKGEIVEMGTYEQLMSHGLDFSALMTAHVNVASQSDRDQAEKERKEKKKTEKKVTTPQDKQTPTQSTARLMTDEDRLIGSVGLGVYKSYFQSMGYLTSLLLVLFYMLDTAVRAVSDWWISNWASGIAKGDDRPGYYIGVYVMISFISLIISLAASISGVISGLAAAVKIHNIMFQRVLRSPIAFFDTTPIGRILNRFTKDINAIDDSLPQTITMALRVSFGVVAPIIIISSVTPFFLILMLPWTFIYKQIQQYYLRSSRELQRLDSISRSPIFSMLSETITGLVTIRAYGKNSSFVHQNEELVDINQTAYDMTIIANRWLSLNLEVLGALIVFGSAFFAVVERSTIAAGLAGLSITYALNLTSQLNWLVRMSTDVETQMVSVERCQHFQNLPTEAEPIIEPRPEPSWPNSGAIEFEHLQMRYRPGLPLVLDDITCQIKPREKIGIVGRTGAGKSSFVSILFRMTELDSGRTTIDGLDISKIGLDDLRSRVAIIPQDPTLFNGTIRSNMDPFDEHKDSELWAALEAVKLHEQVLEMPAKLDAPVTENGENLSVGSRQLLCLARAIVRRPKILVLDEATASVDFDTDALIQKAIRQQFKEVTVLTIAHRINTILDSDRVMVLDKGHLVEFDSPSVLLQNPSSFFYGLVHKSKGIKGVTTSEIVEENANGSSDENYDNVDLS